MRQNGPEIHCHELAQVRHQIDLQPNAKLSSNPNWYQML